MAQMPFMGTIPAKRSPLAQVLEEGFAGYGMGMGLKEKREAGAREEKRLGIAEKRMDVDLKNIEYAKKRDAANMVIEVAKVLEPGAAKTFVEDPKVKALFEDLEWPLPTDLSVKEDFTKTAQDAVARGEPLPGMTMDETKKAAGVLVTEWKITPSVVKEFEKEIPWWEGLIPGKQKKQREHRDIRKKMMEQWGPGGGGSFSDPLGVR